MPVKKPRVKRKPLYAIPQRRSVFGDYFNVPMPPDCDVLIMCVNTGTGLTPVRLMLPHQLYRKVVAKYLREHPGTKQITLVPARAGHYVDLFAEWGRTTADR